MGPYRLRVIRVGSAVACIVDVHVVDKSVAVVVVLREVDNIIETFDGCLHERAHVYLGVVRALSGVVLVIVDLHRSVDVESRTEHAVAARDEEVARTAVGAVLCREALLVHGVGVVLLRVVHRRELLVLELHEDNYRVLFARMREVVRQRLLRLRVALVCVGLLHQHVRVHALRLCRRERSRLVVAHKELLRLRRTHRSVGSYDTTRAQYAARERCILVVARLTVEQNRVTVVGCHEVNSLVAVQSHR